MSEQSVNDSEQLGTGETSVGGIAPSQDYASNPSPGALSATIMEQMTTTIMKNIQVLIVAEVQKALQQTQSSATENPIQEKPGPSRPFRSTLKFSNVIQNSILTEQVDYILWKEKIMTELRSRGCLHFVDNTAEKPKGITEEEMEADRAAVESAIRERLDEKHLRIIKGKHTPIEIIEALDSFRDPVGELAALPIWDKFNDLTYEYGKESAQDFVFPFEQIVDELRRKNEMPEEKTLKRQWLRAVREKCRDLMTREQTCIQMSGKGMTSDQFKKAFLETESTHEALGRAAGNTPEEKEKAYKSDYRGRSHYRNNSSERERDRIRNPKNDNLHWHKDAKITYKGKVVKCTNCGAFGHFKSECKSGDKLLCYECNKYGDHLAADCPTIVKKPTKRKTDNHHDKKSTKRKLVSFQHAKRSKKNYAHLATGIREVDGEFFYVMEDETSSDENVNYPSRREDAEDGAGFKIDSSWN